MPWHNDENPPVNYKTGKVGVKTYEFQAGNRKENEITITSSGVKNFFNLAKEGKIKGVS